MQPNVAEIGHNNPPEQTPFEAVSERIETLYGEAKLWLDGEPVNSFEIAEGIDKLKKLIAEADKEAKAAHKIEKQPWLDGGNEVQARYNPLFEKAKKAKDTCNSALKPWLEKLEEEKRAAEQAARDEAEFKLREAQEAVQSTPHDNLEAREAAEEKVKEAKQAEQAANRAAKDTAKVSGGSGRATSLRTNYRPVMKDPVIAARHYWSRAQDEIMALCQKMAEEDVRGGARDIPGFEIIAEKKAV